MLEENRVFDVTKPQHINPTATSKPVIVGHHPMMSDPMVNDDNAPGPTKIQISDSSQDDNSFLVEPAAEHGETIINPPHHEEPPAHNDLGAGHESIGEAAPDNGAAFKISPADEPPAEPGPLSAVPAEPAEPMPPAGSGLPTDADAPAPPEAVLPETGAMQTLPQIEGLHLPETKHRSNGFKWIAVLVLALIIAGYLAIDSGLVGAGINLPFHVFKQKSAPSTPAAAPAVSNKTAVSSLPAGFKEYKLANTPLTFAAPLAWGDPTSNAEAGYSKRAADAQSDGTYAYLVTFATNKDVQIVVTSGKLLPAARGAFYYDFLQWCTGTSDGKIYQSILHSSTVNKVDTPTTTTCDQGPLTDAVKLDDSTILQAKVQPAGANVPSDIYTKNLNDPALAVFRVKDSATTNSPDIKQLLKTVKLTSTTNPSGQ